MFWIIVLVLVGCFVFGIIVLVWEVLCVLVFWEVEILGGLRNGLKVYGGV